MKMGKFKEGYPRDSSGYGKGKGDDRPMSMSSGSSRPAKPAARIEEGSAERKARSGTSRPMKG